MSDNFGLMWFDFYAPDVEDIYTDDEYSHHPKVEQMIEEIAALVRKRGWTFQGHGTRYADGRPPSDLWESD